MVMKSKVLFAVLLAAVVIGAVFAISRIAKADVLNPGTAFIAQSADSADSSRVGARPGIGRPGIGVRPLIARPLFVRPVVSVFNEENVVVCDEELVLFLEDCIVG